MNGDDIRYRTPDGGKIPLRVALEYAIIGLLWIAFSDLAINSVVSDKATLTQFQTLKGWIFVLVTSGILYGLVAHSVKELSRSEEALWRSESRFRSRYEAIAAGVVVLDTSGVIVNVNESATEILGLSSEHMTGKRFQDQMWDVVRENGEHFPDDERPMAITLLTKEPVRNVVMGVMSQSLPKRRWILSNCEPITNPATGDLVEIVITFLDITQRKEAQDELIRRKEWEQQVRIEAEEAKKEFYKGTIFAVTDGKLNLVTYSEIESLLPLETINVPLSAHEDLVTLRAVVERLSKENGIDDDRTFMLTSAVSEAAANAVKHANGGLARVAAHGGRIQICIQDRGTGMDALVLPKATLMKGFSTKPSMGLGYSLILAVSDTVYLATEKQGTWVLMEECVTVPEPEYDLSKLPDNW